ncbi:MAG: COX15/CtaA family protein [Gammaproteobacteria bacterium]|nr:COX15/CtaA family protein [Gammaproteobacteria bacterium]MBU1972402.1 COX15/CtaA family protein [Gammaproteobacteria bacterium]
MHTYRSLALVATLLAFGVVALGAYVRLSDAGLGCPDWPGCYGHLLGVPDAPDEHATALQRFPGKPVETGKAWKEMVHRYFAGTLGLLILGLALLAWRREMRERASPWLPTALLGIVGFQALLGMWTVTLMLKPVIVSAHLLGGMTTLGLLVWLLLRQSSPRPLERPASLRPLAVLALLAVIAQIALGGWTSSNYAALACTDFPTCQDRWLPPMDFAHAFTLRRELGQTGDGGLLPFAALTAIHWSHRIGAVVVLLAVGGLALRLLRLPAWRRWGIWLAGLLALQWSLGIANVLLSLPLPVAVAHNLGAAALLTATLALNFRLWHRPASNEFAYIP